MARRYFTQSSFDFLKKLEKNNNRDWFNDHKQEYEDKVRGPALDFIADIGEDLYDISPHFLAIPKKVGGSLMRVYRDVRFGKDKRPYKTNIGIQFRHKFGKDVHAPGFYLHLEPNECFVGVGIWRPDAQALGKIRTAISENSQSWIEASRDNVFKKFFEVSGETLKNPPRGYTREHPMIVDLKRKDHIAFQQLDYKRVISASITSDAIKSFKIASPYMKYLCKALDLQF